MKCGHLFIGCTRNGTNRRCICSMRAEKCYEKNGIERKKVEKTMTETLIKRPFASSCHLCHTKKASTNQPPFGVWRRLADVAELPTLNGPNSNNMTKICRNIVTECQNKQRTGFPFVFDVE